jgi:glycosyltransferase involved in cell wall biosynthesis
MSHKKLPVAICIVSHNGAAVLSDCLSSVVDRAQEIIVVSAGSTDATSEIARSFSGVKVLEYPNEVVMKINNMRAFAATSAQWTFFLDDDERFTPDLWEELAYVLPTTSYDGFIVGRKNYLVGTWMRHGGWWPERQPRLFRKGKGSFKMEHVHELLDIDGTVGVITEPFVHLTYRTIREHFRKTDTYTSFQAEKWAAAGVRWSPKNHLVYGFGRPLARFVQKYLLERGFLDGWKGYYAAFEAAHYEFLSYMKIIDSDPANKG